MLAETAIRRGEEGYDNPRGRDERRAVREAEPSESIVTTIFRGGGEKESDATQPNVYNSQPI